MPRVTRMMMSLLDKIKRLSADKPATGFKQDYWR